MTDATAISSPTSALARMSAPWIGLLAFFFTLMWKPLAHTVSVLIHMSFPEGMHYAAAGVVGVIGFVLVWAGFKRDELTATSLGFLGGSLIFLGLVEPSFAMFANILGVQPLMHGGMPVLSPNLLMMQASAIAYFVILIFLGADKDTRCRMFLWFHRNLRLKPNAPTPGYRRQTGRIAALETVMISWFFYILIITVLDPRVIGRDHPLAYVLFWAMLAWGVWLVFFKLARFRAMAPAIRYAIPVAGIVWYGFEMAAQWKWYTEVWIFPTRFPLSNVVIAVLFVAGVVAANRVAYRGAEPAADTGGR